MAGLRPRVLEERLLGQDRYLFADWQAPVWRLFEVLWKESSRKGAPIEKSFRVIHVD